MNIELWVPGSPVGYRTDRGYGGRTLKNDKVTDYQNRILAIALPKIPKTFQGVMAIDVVAVFKRPQRLMRQADPDGVLDHPVKPDCDNIVKSVQDALLGPTAKKYLDWPDDCEVVAGERSKMYAPKGCDSFTFIRIYTPEPAIDRWERLVGRPIAGIQRLL